MINRTKSDRLEKWIAEIAKDIISGKCNDGIIQHIRKHTEELDELPDGIENWVASMENLILIYKQIHNIEITLDHQLQRLQTKYEENPQNTRQNPWSENVRICIHS